MHWTDKDISEGMKFFKNEPDTIGWGGYPHRAWEMESFAIVACDGMGHGCVLYTGGPHVRYELEEVSRCLSDIALDDAPSGLSVWMGRTHGVGSGEDVTTELKGAFRPLNEVERLFVTRGQSPWNEADWGRDPDLDCPEHKEPAGVCPGCSECEHDPYVKRLREGKP